MTDEIDRRDFIKLAAVGALGSGLAQSIARPAPQSAEAPRGLGSVAQSPMNNRLHHVNSTDLRSAIVLGQHPMSNVFNADDHDIPYFLVLARPVALLGFVPNLSEAFIPGLLLAAILRSEEAGLAIDEHAVRTHTRALYFAYEHGRPLALPLNRRTMDGPLTHFLPSNLRSSIAGLAALVARRRSAKARELAEATLQAVLDFWHPSRGWDIQRLQHEGRVTFVDAFAQFPADRRPRFPEFAGAIGSFVNYYRVTRSARALTLLTMIRDHALADYLVAGGEYDPSRLGPNAGNTSARIITMLRGMMQLAAATGDATLMVRVKQYFDRTLPVLSTELGWSRDTPETADEDSDCACRLGKEMDLALLVGEAGFPEGYDRAERILRGYLLPSQLRDTAFFSLPRTGAGDGGRDVAKRTLGSWGFPAPYGHLPEAAKHIMFNTDVVGDVIPALCRALADVARFDTRGHEVNLLFDHSTENIEVRSPYTHDALVLILKRRAPVRVRVPSWLCRSEIEVTGGRALPQLVNGYLYIEEPTARTITLRFPLAARNLEMRYRSKVVRVRLAGDQVLQMDNFGTEATFFDPIIE